MRSKNIFFLFFVNDEEKLKRESEKTKQRELLIVCQKYYDNEVFQIFIKFSFNWPKCIKLLFSITAKLLSEYSDAYRQDSSALELNK